MLKSIQFILIVLFIATGISNASCTTFQSEVMGDTLPYKTIPNYPEKYTPESVIARMIDGVGFRFYWATEGLRKEDLAYKPSPEARTSEQTIDHILGLSNIIINSFTKTVNTQSGEEISSLSFEIKRKKVLENLKKASDMLRSGSISLEDSKILFKRKDKTLEFPFWNQINGPISDALWHIGQVVTFRRSSGNPFNAKVDVFMGK